MRGLNELPDDIQRLILEFVPTEQIIKQECRREHMLNYQKEYRKRRIECTCGKSITRNNLTDHLKTQRRQQKHDPNKPQIKILRRKSTL